MYVGRLPSCEELPARRGDCVRMFRPVFEVEHALRSVALPPKSVPWAVSVSDAVVLETLTIRGALGRRSSDRKAWIVAGGPTR